MSTARESLTEAERSMQGACRAPVPALIVCPRCDGQKYDCGSCGFCANTGYLRERDAEKLAYVERMQIVATFALALGLDLQLSLAAPDQLRSGEGR